MGPPLWEATALTPEQAETWCLCGRLANRGEIAGDPVRVCQSGDHVVVGRDPIRVYIHVENPEDVIEKVGFARPPATMAP